jgi:hypothetical protein
MVGKLVLKKGMEGFRHYLDGEPVHCGELLELRTDDDAWILGRYEWNPKAGGEPFLCIDEEAVRLTSVSVLAGREGKNDRQTFRLPRPEP